MRLYHHNYEEIRPGNFQLKAPENSHGLLRKKGKAPEALI